MEEKPREEFASHALNATGLAKVHHIRLAFSRALNEIMLTAPAGRARALVVTHMQDACMWAVRGVAEDKENQV